MMKCDMTLTWCVCVTRRFVFLEVFFKFFSLADTVIFLREYPCSSKQTRLKKLWKSTRLYLHKLLSCYQWCSFRDGGNFFFRLVPINFQLTAVLSDMNWETHETKISQNPSEIKESEFIVERYDKVIMSFAASTISHESSLEAFEALKSFPPWNW